MRPRSRTLTRPSCPQERQAGGGLVMCPSFLGLIPARTGLLPRKWKVYWPAPRDQDQPALRSIEAEWDADFVHGLRARIKRIKQKREREGKWRRCRTRTSSPPL